MTIKTEILTEDMIERIVSSRTNDVDRQYMAGNMTDEQYRKALDDIDEWSRKEYNKLP